MQVRCLVDVPGDKLPSMVSGELQQYLQAQVAPQIPDQLRDAFLAAIDAGRIRSMQNKLMPAKPLHRPGALLLGKRMGRARVRMQISRGRLRTTFVATLPAGDAFNMRHPLTGGGMTVALSDTNLLADMLRPLPDFNDSLATAATTAQFYTKRKPLSATVNTLANALYQARHSILLL